MVPQVCPKRLKSAKSVLEFAEVCQRRLRYALSKSKMADVCTE
jgi:hypothetical protein